MFGLNFARLWPLLLGGLGLLMLAITGRRNGQLSERVKRAKASAEVNERMRNAAADSPRTRDGVADRLRDGRF